MDGANAHSCHNSTHASSFYPHLFCQFFVVSAISLCEGISDAAFRNTDSQHRSVSMAHFSKLALRLWLSVNQVTSSHLPGTPFPPLEHLLHTHFQTVSLVSVLQGRHRHRVRRRKQQAISFPCSPFSSVKKERVVSKPTLNCRHFSQVKFTWSVDSSILFSLHFRLIASTSSFF